jgi:hypothetical protein
MHLATDLRISAGRESERSVGVTLWAAVPVERRTARTGSADEEDLDDSAIARRSGIAADSDDSSVYCFAV